MTRKLLPSAGPPAGRSGPARASRVRRIAGAALGVGLSGCILSGCAVYHSQPLPTAPDLQTSADRLKVDVDRLRVAPLKPVMIDPRDGLDPIEIAVLAVLNNPDLAAKRAAMGVSSAQVFAAGLLPDPQLSAGYDNPISGPDTQKAYSGSAQLDIAGLIAVVNQHRAAKFTRRQADLDLLWAEWITAQQARQLAETVLADEAKAEALRPIAAAAADRAGRSSAALKRGDVSGPAAAADLAAKLDAETGLATAEHDAQKARRDLNALLNLEAGAPLPLVPGPEPTAYDAAAVQKALAQLPQRRPDLLALRAGYNAQDANVRKAILAQFPIANAVYNYARDPAGTTTVGAAMAFALPIFNGGRGEVRVQNATREQLRAEYQARLDQTDAEVRNAQAELASAERSAALLRADLPRLEPQIAPGAAAFRRGDLDSQAYLTLLQNVLAKRADLADRALAARLAEIQLETALFLPPANFRAAQ